VEVPIRVRNHHHPWYALLTAELAELVELVELVLLVALQKAELVAQLMAHLDLVVALLAMHSVS
jgi:hypothetical protein